MAEKISKSVRIRRIFPESLVTHFFHQMIIQHQGDQFILSFFEIWQPPIVGTEEEGKRMFEELKEIESKCVARLITTPDQIKEIIKALTDNLQKYENKKEQQQRATN